jgi:hypothetical protein
MLDLDRKVPTLLYIGRGGRVTMRAIRLADWISSLLHGMRNRLILAIVQTHLSRMFLACLGLHVGWLPRPSWASSLMASGLITWTWSYIQAVQVPLAHISDKVELVGFKILYTTQSIRLHVSFLVLDLQLISCRKSKFAVGNS